MLSHFVPFHLNDKNPFLFAFHEFSGEEKGGGGGERRCINELSLNDNVALCIILWNKEFKFNKG
jgi:hypothetical protein